MVDSQTSHRSLTPKAIDVPSPINLREMSDARRWADAAMLARPARSEIFVRIVDEIRAMSFPSLSVVELGSGPGFLAHETLSRLRTSAYTALDFSDAMHTLARERLGPLAQRVRFVERDFKQPEWGKDIDAVDAVVTVQAVHELRHKQHVPQFYREIVRILRPSGLFLMCDHYVGDDGQNNRALFMTLEEHESALRMAGLSSRSLMRVKGLVLYRCQKLESRHR